MSQDEQRPNIPNASGRSRDAGASTHETPMAESRRAEPYGNQLDPRSIDPRHAPFGVFSPQRAQPPQPLSSGGLVPRDTKPIVSIGDAIQVYGMYLGDLVDALANLEKALAPVLLPSYFHEEAAQASSEPQSRSMSPLIEGMLDRNTGLRAGVWALRRLVDNLQV
jgi:hypothetical protein